MNITMLRGTCQTIFRITSYCKSDDKWNWRSKISNCEMWGLWKISKCVFNYSALLIEENLYAEIGVPINTATYLINSILCVFGNVPHCTNVVINETLNSQSSIAAIISDGSYSFVCDFAELLKRTSIVMRD